MAQREALQLLAGALDPEVRIWESFEMRLFGGRLDSTSTVDIAAHFVHLQGCFGPTTDDELTEVLDRPAMWRARLTAEAARAMVASWANDEPATLGETRIAPPPQLGHMNFAWARRRDSDYYIGTQLLCSDDISGLSGWWILTASSMNVDPFYRNLNTEFHNGAQLLGITDHREFSMRYMARDLSHFNSPEISIVLPGPLRATVAWADESTARVDIHVHRYVGLNTMWASVDDGAWDVQQPRPADWEVAAGEPGWEHGRQLLPVHPPSKVHIGRERSVELTMEVPELSAEPVGGDSAGLLERLYARFRTGAMRPILSPVKRDKSIGSDFELLVRNLLGDAGLAIIDVGHAFQMPGIDALALDHGNARAYVISVTLGYDIQKKAKDLAGNRTFVSEGLPGWTLGSVVVSALPRSDLSQDEITAAGSLGVSVLAREEVEAAIADRATLRIALDPS